MPYHHLTPSERKVIYSMRRAQYPMRSIALALGRSPCTISRELRRNTEQRRPYCPHLASILYWQRRERLVVAHKMGNARLMAYVKEKLKQAWSPEQIAGRLCHVDYPYEPAMHISHESIYRYVWADKHRGGKLFRHLRHGRKRYHKYRRNHAAYGQIKGRVLIDERPAVVAKQGRVGDWEGDTFFGCQRKSCITTLVERKMLYLVARKMPDCRAQSLNQAVLEGLSAIPKALLHTLTVDNGKEFARFKVLEEPLGLKVYFAHPYSAWERPINENLNGLLRQFLPRKTDFHDVTQEQLEQIVRCLNDRPRKKLNYRTPSEDFNKACVALEG